MLRINNIKITFYPTTFQPIPKLFYYRPSTFIQTTKKISDSFSSLIETFNTEQT